jgi:hypothetical protein
MEERFRVELRTHNLDPYAHGTARTRADADRSESLAEIVERVDGLEVRMSKEELWRAYLTGGFAVLSFLFGGGVIVGIAYALVIHK